jgi:hypothetical protein
VKVFLAGEGRTELGDWAREPCYRPEAPEPGLLEALLRKLKPDGWTIVDAVCWKHLPRERRSLPRPYRAHEHISAEVGNVLGLVLRARDAGSDTVVFSRDRDRDLDREKDVLEGLSRASSVFAGRPKIAGGMAVEMIESWVASLQGTKRAESFADPSSLLADSSLEGKRAVVAAADLAGLPADAHSLRRWLANAASVFGLE